MAEHDGILSDAEREALAMVSDLPASKQLVLVVDDNPVNSLALCRYLKSKGVEAVSADGGDAAMDVLEREPRVGLMITDLRMQPMDGLELIQWVHRSRWAALPIIVVSGDTDVEEAVDVMHLGVVDFLLKPVDLDRLMGQVRYVLRMDQG